jgi:hypothetical protein
VDALPPSPPAQAPFVYAAGDIGARNDEERDLCERASRTDWLYLGVLLASDVGAIYLDSWHIQYAGSPGVRLIGPSVIGLTWGATLGGGFLALPKCSPHWIDGAPPEGGMRSATWTALAIGLLAGATAPVIVGVQSPYFAPPEWSTSERALRLILSGGTGFLGAMIPYALPPRTWRAAKELERIRAGADDRGAFVSYTLRF